MDHKVGVPPRFLTEHMRRHVTESCSIQSIPTSIGASCCVASLAFKHHLQLMDSKRLAPHAPCGSWVKHDDTIHIVKETLVSHDDFSPRAGPMALLGGCTNHQYFSS